MLRVGLTGGIASGKSTVAGLLHEHGAVVIDADVISREVVAPGTPALAEIVGFFGATALDERGELDRGAMGRRVFADQTARRQLEAIIHPRVEARSAEIERAARPDAIVVHDIPLLVETGQASQFDVLIVVDVADDVQRDRLTRLRGMSEEEVRARVASQITRDQRLAAADYVMRNNGSREQLRAAVEGLWPQLRTLAKSQSSEGDTST